MPPVFDLRKVLEDDARYRVKHLPHRTVLYVPGKPGHFVKVFRHKNLRKWLSSHFKVPAAWRERMVARVLLDHGIPTYRPVASGRLYEGHVPVGSVFVSEEIEHATSLTDWLDDPTVSAGFRRRLLVDYGRLVARVHSLGFFLKDVNAANVIVQRAPGTEPRLFVIDHEATRPLVGYLRRYRDRDIRYALRSGPRGRYAEEDQAAFAEGYAEIVAGRAAAPRRLLQLVGALVTLQRSAEKFGWAVVLSGLAF